MLNDTTILRLRFPDGALEQIRPRALEQLTSAIEAVAKAELARHGVDGITMWLVAAPRRGSLEFHYKVDISFKVGNKEVAASVPHEARRIVSRMSELAVIGAFFWCVIFGGNGIFDLLRGTSLTNNLPSLTEEARARHAIASMPSKRPRYSQGAPAGRFRALVQAAKDTGAREVEIELPDERPITLFRTDDGRSR